MTPLNQYETALIKIDSLNRYLDNLGIDITDFANNLKLDVRNQLVAKIDEQFNIIEPCVFTDVLIEFLKDQSSLTCQYSVENTRQVLAMTEDRLEQILESNYFTSEYYGKLNWSLTTLPNGERYFTFS